MNNILFPTDFSEAANQAFVYALHIADRFDATITTLHVYQKPDLRGSHVAITLQDMLVDFDLLEFENYKDSIPPLVEMARNKGFSHLKIQHVLEENSNIKEGILKVAERDKADLIVMGTTGARGLKELLVGSIAGEILENANCPVLTVPEKSTFDGTINRIAFTTNYQKEEKKALEKIRQFAAPFKASVTCINVDLPHTEFHTHRMEKLQEEYKNVEGLHFEVIDGTDIFKEVTHYLDEHQIDILAMVTHQRNFLEELFHYSKTKAMSYHAQTPVLSIQAHLLEEEG